MIHAIADVVTVLLFAYLALVMPIRGRALYQQFRLDVVSDPTARMRYYRKAMVAKSVLTVVAVVLYFANDRRGYGVQLIAHHDSQFVEVTLPWLIAGVVGGAILLRWRISRTSLRPGLLRALRPVVDLLPRTPLERKTWGLVSLNAGITEEILFRAFVMTVLVEVFGGRNETAIVLVAGAMFGIAHLYQGIKGVVLTAVVGALLCEVVLSSGLVLAIVLHAAINMRLLILPPELVLEAERARDTEPEGGSAPGATA